MNGKRLHKGLAAASSLALLLAPHMAFAGTHHIEASPEIQCEGQEDNLRTYLEMSRALFNERDVERVAEFYTEGFISHNVDEGGIGIHKVPLTAMQAMWRRIEQIEPDREVINNLIVCQGDLVIAQVTTQGTHIGPGLKGNPQGGRRYRTSAIDIYRFKDGKVVERWGNNDMPAKARQLGMELDLTFSPLPEGEAKDPLAEEGAPVALSEPQD
ncbi:ester cyclase [Altererythrobacter sp. GH1-8]|uniref:ester cyclase n=1 Tax=Altererythrobacter sp. GH1-8 TaxID=3349333 RepID=UPI00374DE5E9